MSFTLGLLLLAVVTAVTCSLPGNFLVLRKNSMLVDAISHAVLPGIVLGYFFTQNLNSVWLIIGAALSGLVVVLGSEWLSRTGLLTGDASQGLIFPALFSVGVILISANFSNIHLDVDSVLVGDLNLAAWKQLTIGDLSLGPSYLYVMVAMLAVNIVLIGLLYRRLKVTTFDEPFAKSLGIRTGLLNTVFMLLVSVTIVVAYHVAGSILVISLMVVPAATAHLVTKSLPKMMFTTALIAATGAVAGFWVSYGLNAPTTATMAVFYGLIFLAVMFITRARSARRARGI